MLRTFIETVESHEPSGNFGIEAGDEIGNSINIALDALADGVLGPRPAIVAQVVSGLAVEGLVTNYISDEPSSDTELVTVMVDPEDGIVLTTSGDFHHQLYRDPIGSLATMAGGLEMARYFLSQSSDTTNEVGDIKTDTAMARSNAMAAEAMLYALAASDELGYRPEFDEKGTFIIQTYPNGYADLSPLATAGGVSVVELENLGADALGKLAGIDFILCHPRSYDIHLVVGAVEAMRSGSFTSLRDIEQGLRAVNSGGFLFARELADDEVAVHPITGREMTYAVMPATVRPNADQRPETVMQNMLVSLSEEREKLTVTGVSPHILALDIED